jgi:hypothetical protein
MIHSLLLSGSSCPVSGSSFQVAEKLISFQCDVIFGSPSMDCRGTGICKITGTNSVLDPQIKRDCTRTKATVQLTANGTTVNLYFLRADLCSKLYRFHFWKGVFELFEPCEIPTDFCANLGVERLSMLPGSYRIIENQRFVVVQVAVG